MDKVIDTFGRQLLNLCITLDIHIVNGRCGDDTAIGEYTYIAPSGKSVIDYVLMSTDLFDHVDNFYVHERSDSWHFPLYCSLNIIKWQRHN